MLYLKVKWLHTSGSYPALLYSELDEERRETRKVEVFADRRMRYASSEASTGDTALSVEPVPPSDEIAKDPQFLPAQITKEEFESVWVESHRPTPTDG